MRRLFRVLKVEFLQLEYYTDSNLPGRGDKSCVRLAVEATDRLTEEVVVKIVELLAKYGADVNL